MAYRPPNPGWGAAATKAKTDEHGGIIQWGPSYGEGQDEVPAVESGDGTTTSSTGTTSSSSGTSSSSSSGGSSNFDATTHPYYRQVKSILDAMSVAERANFRNQIQGILISFGLVPGNFVDKFGALDDVTKQLIQKNTDTKISRWARMLEGLQLQNTDLVNRLTAQGLRRSGARGAGLRRNQLGFDRESSDAIGSLLGNIGNMYGSYSMNEYQRQLQLANALAWVYQNYFTPGTSGPGGTDPTKPPTGPTADPYGRYAPGGNSPSGTRDSQFYYNNFDWGYRGGLLF